MIIKTFHKTIVPLKLIYDRKIFRITNISKDYIIRGYKVKIGQDNKFISLHIKSLHPNANTSGKFCMESYYQTCIFDNEMQKMLEKSMSVFSLDNCYFRPWGDVEYEEYEKINY